MPILNTTHTITLTAGGGTENLPMTSQATLYIITGTATLTSNWTIQPSGTAILGAEYRFRYQANIDLDGNDITIFGVTLPTNLADKTHEISCYYNGSAWEVNFQIDVDEDGSIPDSLLQNMEYNSVTVSHTMANGQASPSIASNLGAPYGTLGISSDLRVRALPNSNILEVIGSFAINSVDETSVGTSFAYKFLDTTYIPTTTKYHSAIARISEGGGNYRLVPIRICSGDPATGLTERGVWVVVDEEVIGAYNNAQYTIYLNLKIKI